MPQAEEWLREKWGGYEGVAEDRATSFLLSRGWQHEMFVWHSPYDAMSVDEYEAVMFLISEWDHAYGGTIK